MDPDLAFVVGVVVGIFSIPAAVSSLSDGRAPRAAAVAIIISGGLIVWALSNSPTGYRINDIPDVMVRVVARFIG